MALVLTIDPAQTLSSVVARLKREKVAVASALDGLHMLIVEGDEATAAKLRRVPGVVNVVADETVSVDPGETPDMGLGWPGNADRSASPPVRGASWRSAAWKEREG